MSNLKSINPINSLYDAIIIGSGAAGLTAALKLSENKDLKIAVLSKDILSEGSTRYAQGGIAAVQSNQDSFESHIQDTLKAGAGLCDLNAVKFTVYNAKKALEWLIDLGVDFTKSPDKNINQNQNKNKNNSDWPYHLTQEGGHSARRIIHSDDKTGQSVSKTLIQKVKAQNNIFIFEKMIAIDLIIENLNLNNKYCRGVYALNELTQSVEAFPAKVVMLATGGASRVYLYSSNPAVSSGDGIAMAYRAGCDIKDMEFNQFHPTCLYHPEAGSFLITEAMRGEGAVLKRPDGSRFMPEFDERAELAPRDIVARAIDFEMKRLGVECMYLDISHKSKSFIISHFPTIYKKCLNYGFDITQEAIPIVPAAHYTCGGVVINQKAQTNIQNLYAAGEVSCTGLHGANRMASNSLSECLVYAMSASENMLLAIQNYSNQFNSKLNANQKPIKPWDDSNTLNIDEHILIAQNWDEIRRFMWNYVGIVRSENRLKRAKARIELLQKEIKDYYMGFKLDKSLIELRNLAQIAELIINAALSRKESCGLHYVI